MWPNLEELFLGTKTSKQDFTSAQLLLVLPRLTKLKKLCLSFKRPKLEEDRQLIKAMEVELNKHLSSIHIQFKFIESYDCKFDCLFNPIYDDSDEYYDSEYDEEDDASQLDDEENNWDSNQDSDYDNMME